MSSGSQQRFNHLALLYEGDVDFMARTLPFVREGLAEGEPVMVATSAAKCGSLAERLDGEAERVEFVDMGELGRNPARIIPAWREFAGRHAGSPTRGIGEPAWPGRSADELVECGRHESLLNLAFERGPPMKLLCAYDAASLDPRVIEGARRTHPSISADGAQSESSEYQPPERAPSPFEGELSPPPSDARMLAYERPDDVRRLRSFVLGWADDAGLAERAHDLALAAHELVSNSMRHAGARGTLRAWRGDGAVVCEVRDSGRIEQPLAGRELPPEGLRSGRGLWIVNHLCDLVQIRSGAAGTRVRIRMELDPEAALG